MRMWKNSEKTDGQFGKEKNALKNSSARSIDVNQIIDLKLMHDWALGFNSLISVETSK